jgi:hypothetical protein
MEGTRNSIYKIGIENQPEDNQTDSGEIIYKDARSVKTCLKSNPVAAFCIMIIIIIIYLLTAIGLIPGGSGYFTCIQNTKLITTKFKLGGLHEKHVLATWKVGNQLSICF